MKQLNEKEVIEIIERELPRIIEKHPEVRMRIEEILERKAATKDDIKAVLLELQRQREETNRRFEAMERRFEAMERRFEALQREMNERFEAMERRFEAMDRRFEALQREMNERFEAMERRFEAMERRFEAMDRRFEALQREMDRRFEAVQMEIATLNRTVSALGSRWGLIAENSFRRGFREVLSQLGYEVVKWRRMDREGKFFVKPRTAEIDILIRDDRRIAIEVKSSLSYGELENFERTIRFYESVEGEKVDEALVVTMYCYPGVREYAEELGIKVLIGYEEGEEYLK